MKKTILTIASVAALAGVADAQTVHWFNPVSSGTSTYNVTGIGDVRVTISGDNTSSDPGVEWKAPSGSSYDWSLGSLTRYTHINSPTTPQTTSAQWVFEFLDGPVSSSDLVFMAGNLVDSTLGRSSIRLNGGIGGWSMQSEGAIVGAPTASTAAQLHQNTSPSQWNIKGSSTSANSDDIFYSFSGGSDITGVTVQAFNSPGDNYYFNFGSSVVPEPSSTALLGLGALGLLVRRKR